MVQSHKATQVANQVDGVLQDYLDQLLISATTLAASAPAASPSSPVATAKSLAQASAPSIPIAPSPAPLSPKPSVKQASKVELPALKTEVTQSTTLSPQSSQETEAKMALDLSNETQIAKLNWRDSQGIECLIFKVGGLKLAIPLPLLGGVFPVTEKITPLFGQADWSLGVWQGDIKLTLIDTALLIMPERNVSLKDAGYDFFIQLDRSPWALACQEICDTQTLNYDAIKWRGDTSKRPWLAGTVIDEMCALVDVQGVLELLETNTRASSAR